MKNIPIPNADDTKKCDTYSKKCNTGFISTTPNGGDYVTCPICGGLDENDETVDIDFKAMVPNISDSFYFCDNCRILYNLGCTHAVNGCTDDDYFGKIITKWSYNETEYDGMVQFADYREFMNMIHGDTGFKIIESKCCCVYSNCDDHKDCSIAGYPKNKFPQYYRPYCSD